MRQSPVGVLNIDKPQGFTSHDVVARVRKLAGIRRVGHAGTLDPLATGVLLVCVGAATRITDYLQAGRKIYRTTLRLGETTDTYDAEGRIMQTAPVPELSAAELEGVLHAFRGELQQVPPMYSAVKHQGKALYELARAGIEIERKPRQITVFDLVIEDWQSPHLTLRIECSPGTYVRSLAYDIGLALGCGAHVRTLRRLASGSWRVEDAVTLETLLGCGERWTDYLHGLRASLSMLPPLVLPAEEAHRFALGQRLALTDPVECAEVRVLGPGERLIGIGRVDTEECILSPYKVLADPAVFAPVDGKGRS